MVPTVEIILKSIESILSLRNETRIAQTKTGVKTQFHCGWDIYENTVQIVIKVLWRYDCFLGGKSTL